MEKHSFLIKVADLLHTPGATDTIQLVDKFSTRFPHSIHDGIQATLLATGLNDTDIHIFAKKIALSYHCSCDRCGREFIARLTTTNEEITASTENKKEDAISIDKKNGRVDLEKWIIASLITHLPIKILCKKCEKQSLDEDREDTEYTTIIRKK